MAARVPRPSTRLLLHKYYVDELYDAAIVQPIKLLSTGGLWKGADAGVIDGAVNGVGQAVRAASSACCAGCRPDRSAPTRPRCFSGSSSSGICTCGSVDESGVNRHGLVTSDERHAFTDCFSAARRRLLVLLAGGSGDRPRPRAGSVRTFALAVSLADVCGDAGAVVAVRPDERRLTSSSSVTPGFRRSGSST